MTLSQATATAGTQITLSPTGTAPVPMDNENIYVSTTPSTEVTYLTGWTFNMPASNVSVNCKILQDPQLTFSSDQGHVYINDSQYNTIPQFSYVQGYDTQLINYFINDAGTYEGDIYLDSNHVPTVRENSNAYTYIVNGNTITCEVLVTGEPTDTWKYDEAGYTAYMQLYT